MTDEEKAEEYVLYIPDTVGAKHSVYSEEKLKQAFKDGLAEGRKETFSEAVIKNLKENTSVMTAVIMGKLSEKCERLEKENGELKEKLKEVVVAFNNYECAGTEQEQDKNWDVLSDFMHGYLEIFGR